MKNLLKNYIFEEATIAFYMLFTSGKVEDRNIFCKCRVYANTNSEKLSVMP